MTGLPRARARAPVPGEQVLLDGQRGRRGARVLLARSSDVSTDGTRLLYGVDVEGDERYTLRATSPRVKTSATSSRTILPGPASRPDGRFVVYMTMDDARRPDTVWSHEVGNGCHADVRPSSTSLTSGIGWARASPAASGTS
ncbi:MAG: hypothetical protein R2692_03550 [Microbacterium sp.]